MIYFEYVVVVAGYFTIALLCVVMLTILLYLFYWIVLIPLHCSIMFKKAYKMHEESDVWTDEYKAMRFKVIQMWVKGMKQPFHCHNAKIEGSLITIDYTGRMPKTTITK